MTVPQPATYLLWVMLEPLAEINANCYINTNCYSQRFLIASFIKATTYHTNTCSFICSYNFQKGKIFIKVHFLIIYTKGFKVSSQMMMHVALLKYSCYKFTE